MSDASTTRLITLARCLSALAGIVAAVALLGYVTGAPLLFRVWLPLQAMSPLTGAALLCLSLTGLAAASGRTMLVRPSALLAGVAVITTLLSRASTGGDWASPWLAGVLSRLPADQIGRTSPAAAFTVLTLCAAFVLRRRRAGAADVAAGLSLVVSGIALLGYLYGVADLYAVSIFSTMALNTAAALFLLSLAALLVDPERGLAGVIGSTEIGGSATRRQLAFLTVPVVAGWLLLHATRAADLGPGLAMALLVIVTVVSLALLVLRDGRTLNTLSLERRDRADLQDRLAAEMAERLSRQADELRHESEERVKAEAAMYRAQRMEAVGQLTGGIAHDFNNLLMAIRGNLELMGGRLPEGEARLRRYLDNATAAADKGAKVTAQLLAFSRSQRLDIRPVELDPLLRSARELIGNALGASVELTVDLRAEGAWVMTDPDQLELAILNLAVNARDAMPGGGRIRVESAPCGERLAAERDDAAYVSVRVIDDGTGMSAEVAAQAVEPFFTTKERGKGTGLGLAQVYGFVGQCRGDFRIASEPGRGTTVELLLRCADPEPVVAGPEDAADALAPQRTLGRKVLVIDHDDGVRAVIVDALRATGFEVVEASNGEAGLALLDAAEPTAAVIDFLMPGMNGAEVARIAQQRRPGLPIVFVSGYSDTVALDGIAGATVLRKPFDLDGLGRALSSVLH